MSFCAKCVLFNIKTEEKSEVTVSSIEDIIQVIANGDRDKICQVSIDKYNKVYYCLDDRIGFGVSGWIKEHEYYEESIDSWIPFESKDFFSGENLLFVLCNDSVPIDITKDALDFMMSCVTY